MPDGITEGANLVVGWELWVVSLVFAFALALALVPLSDARCQRRTRQWPTANGQRPIWLWVVGLRLGFSLAGGKIRFGLRFGFGLRPGLHQMSDVRCQM